MEAIMKKRLRLTSPYILLFVVLTLGFQSCRSVEQQKKRIVYVNSYHREFPPSAEITAGVFETLPEDRYEVFDFFIDSKRNPEEEFIKQRTAEILNSIQEEKPDLLIVSDDNAVKYLVEPNPQISIPIVFCGVNWSADQYDLSHHNITGILEILPVEEVLVAMKPYYPSMQRLLVLNENTTTSRKTKPYLDAVCERVGISVTQELVDDFESWKAVFKEANQSYDVIYLQTRGAIKDWDHDEALKVIDEHIRVPLVTCESFMMPYSVFGLTQISKEQGVLAAQAAIRILEGTRPDDIPVSRNHQTTVWVNSRLADKIGFQPDERFLEDATIVN
jgi:ABC-type uncharacterized transport system substrate-binding protein